MNGGPFSGPSGSVMVKQMGFGSVEHIWTLLCPSTGALSLTSTSLITNVPVPVAGSTSTEKKKQCNKFEGLSIQFKKKWH